MRITTDRKAALADQGNRAAALAEILRLNDDADTEGVPVEDMAQWIDDVINDWVDELAHDLRAGNPPPV